MLVNKSSLKSYQRFTFEVNCHKMIRTLYIHTYIRTLPYFFNKVFKINDKVTTKFGHLSSVLFQSDSQTIFWGE